MQQFVKAGRIVKDRHALRVELDGRNGPGDLVIGATAVPELLSGRRVEVNFVQCRTPDRVFIGYSGEAWLSRPVPAGVIDADKAQREVIDADLVRSF